MMATKAQVEHTREVEYIALADLMTRLHPQNAKGHNIGGIIEAYKEHGYVELGTIDDRTGYFLAGHGRTQALSMMKKQKMAAPDGIRNGGSDWLVPVNVGYSSKDDIHALAYLAASNKLTIDGGWNEPMLAELLQEVANDVSVELESTGFDAEELDNLLRDLGMQDAPADDPGAQVDRAAELNEKWQVQRGDVWQISNHRIMCGDSTCAEDVALLMDGVKADLCLTDPPYGEINSEWDKQVVWWDILDMVISNNTYLAFTTSMKYWLKISDKLEKSGFSFRYDCVWNKPNGMLLGKAPMRGHENIAVYTKKDCEISELYFDGYSGGEDGDPWMVVNKKTLAGESNKGTTYSLNSQGSHSGRADGRRHVMTSWYASKGNIRYQDGMNAASKPVRIFEKLILTLCKAGGLVYDPFLGSGTTIVACEQTGRTGYGMELHEPYVAVCLERLAGMGLAPERSK